MTTEPLQPDEETVKITVRYAFLGKPRTGKTTLARAMIEDKLKEDSWITSIWSNTPIYQAHDHKQWDTPHNNSCPLHPLYRQIRYLRQLEKARNGIALIDEISKAIPSRKVGHHTTDIYNLIQEVMSNLGRHNVHLFYTDQWRRGADIMIRQGVTRVFLPIMSISDINHSAGNVPLMFNTFQPTSTEFTEMEHPQSEMTSSHTDMNIREIVNLFRTQEPIQLTYNPPFKIDSWTNSFNRWCKHHGYIIIGMKPGTVRNILDLYQIKKNQYITSKELSAVLGKLKVDGQM